LRPAVSKSKTWVYRIAAAAFVAALLCDWMQPPRRQVSVAVYNTAVVGGYRLALKPMIQRVTVCRFRPSCSLYSEKAMQVHGFPKGLWLTTSRLFRCMPWEPLGTRDPVPDR